MSYAKFTLYNLIGAVAWVVSLCLAGYWLGNIPWVRQNLTLIIVLMLAIPAFPALLAYLRSRKS